MARLTRKNIKVFAENATNNGVFGSLQAGNPVTTSNVEQVQSLPAWSTGWNSATMTSEKLPPLEEFQGVQYVTTYQQAYLMQEGIPEWASTVTYYKGSIAKEVTSNGFRIYYSLTNDNTNNLLSDTSSWKKVMDSSDLYAFDNNVVHLTGNETIGGAKTFTDDVDIKKNFPAIFLRENDVVKGTNPQSEQGWTIYCQDSSNTSSGTSRLGFFSTRLGTNGSVITIMSAYKNEANSDDYASIRVYYPQSGSPYATCPTPTDTTSVGSTQIATAGWVNSTGNNVVHRTDNETIAGTKTFSSTPIVGTKGNSDNSTAAASTAFVKNILEALYPVGSIYIGTQSTCPLASLISGSTWTKISGDKVLQSSSSNHGANTTIAAGLPNIIGSYNARCLHYSTSQEAVSANALYQKKNDGEESWRRQNAGGTDGSNMWPLAFDASRSNSIYGNSSTVQPPAYVVNVWRRTA